MSERLGRQEWIDAGLRAMADAGVDAVRVERLAETLGVTKGSFYWHFRDRGALLSALVEAWRDRATTNIISQVEAGGGDAVIKLRALFSITTRSDGRLDLAMRSWASQDDKAREILKSVDQKRYAYLKALLGDVGFDPPAAAARARFAYNALIGQFVMGRTGAPRDASSETLDIILPMLVRRAD